MAANIATRKPRKYKLWHAILFYGIVSIAGFLSTGGKKKGRKLYDKEQKQAPWAPPGWVFGPAWSFNNMFLVWGLLKILNKPDLPYRNRLLAQQALMWIIFLSFGYVYFKKKSPVLAEIWTQTDALLATASFVTALKADKKLSIAYLPLLLWTWFASSLSAWQVANNPDPLLKSIE